MTLTVTKVDVISREIVLVDAKGPRGGLRLFTAYLSRLSRTTRAVLQDNAPVHLLDPHDWPEEVTRAAEQASLESYPKN